MEIKRYKIDGESLRNNRLNDDFKRDLIVIENNVNDRTPVLIGLAGFFGSSESFLNRSYTGMDFLSVLNIISKDYSFIIALPDTMTSLRGNQYLNSMAVGNYEDFIVKDVLKHLDDLYGPRDKYLFGKSSGGFGAINLSMKHDEFSGFIDISGDSYFYYSYLNDFPVAYNILKKTGIDDFIDNFNKKYIHSNDELTAMNIVAMSAFYSRNDKINLPFDLSDGSLNQYWNDWLSFDPVSTVNNYLENLRKKRIVLQTGIHDEFKMYIGMKIISRTLERNNIDHVYIEYDAGHFNTNHFYLDSIPVILKNY
ncbi:alpha/beta hydrolase-fold protein [Picrophilus oshimae]|uniref:Hypothetical glycosylase n=1 Tax=Picrophilus torridus (strain ATCC 700027 / DSM 9790 / JCM 10055 / NBRC 100828 / KAW 2/3) TaxID=1122961 RepID=Q6L018_PICTO|nr:alpha/beta hydrolase-fold protein [Picrophilus oshimae]AAT43684.1 hypothetical glycosylase [Picrophilus oshimae DSM 9789]